MIFRFPGGKTKHQKKFLKYLPENFKEARFPFVGGGGIFWLIDIEKKRWINDVNEDLMSVYFALKFRPDHFISQCNQIDPEKEEEVKVKTKKNGTSDKIYNERLKKWFDFFVEHETSDQALRYFFINRTVWGGRVNYDSYMKSRLYFSNPSGWNIVKGNKLQKAAEIIKDTTATSLDYKLLLVFPGEDVWIYNDPPYLSHTDLAKTDKLYQYEFSLKDHRNLLNELKKCKHKWCLSYNDCDEIREWYKDYYIFEEEWSYCGSSKKQKDKGKELVITNYPVESSLKKEMIFEKQES